MQRTAHTCIFFVISFHFFFKFWINIVCTTQLFHPCGYMSNLVDLGHFELFIEWFDLSICIRFYVPFIDAARIIPQGKQHQINNRTLLFCVSARSVVSGNYRHRVESTTQSRASFNSTICHCASFLAAFSAKFTAPLFYRINLSSASAELQVISKLWLQ